MQQTQRTEHGAVKLVRMSESLHREVKALAASRGVCLAEMLDEVVRAGLRALRRGD